MNVLGIGHAGCQIAKYFSNLSQYRVFSVDTEDDGYENFIKVKRQNSHEDYEKNYSPLKLKNCKGETLVVLSGAGKISGLALRLLNQLKDNDIYILYIKPNKEDMSQQATLRHRTTIGVLQQYARSDVFKRMYVIDNEIVESVADGASIQNYWQEINNIIASTFHMLKVFENTEPLLNTTPTPPITSKIATYGVVNYDSFKEKAFYGLQGTRCKKYFFGINSASLEQDKGLLKKIRSFVGKESDEKIDAGFAIYSTDYEKNYVYCEHYTTLIQEEKEI